MKEGEKMIKQKPIDFDEIYQMSLRQQQQMYYALAKRANQRFRDIEKTKMKSGAVKKAKSYLKDVYGRATFIQSKKLTGLQLQEGLKALEEFFNSKTSSRSGVREVMEKHVQIFKDKGIEIVDKKKFFNFLSSKQFKTLSKYVPSDELVEDFNNAMDDGYKVGEIKKQYQDYLNSEMTFEQVAERRNKGGMLK